MPPHRVRAAFHGGDLLFAALGVGTRGVAAALSPASSPGPSSSSWAKPSLVRFGLRPRPRSAFGIDARDCVHGVICGGIVKSESAGKTKVEIMV